MAYIVGARTAITIAVITMLYYRLSYHVSNKIRRSEGGCHYLTAGKRSIAVIIFCALHTLLGYYMSRIAFHSISIFTDFLSLILE